MYVYYNPHTSTLALLTLITPLTSTLAVVTLCMAALEWKERLPSTTKVRPGWNPWGGGGKEKRKKNTIKLKHLRQKKSAKSTLLGERGV